MQVRRLSVGLWRHGLRSVILSVVPRVLFPIGVVTLGTLSGCLSIDGFVQEGRNDAGIAKDASTSDSMQGNDSGIDPPKVQLSVALDDPLAKSRVISTPAGIDCPGKCSATLPVGSKVQLSAKAGPNVYLVKWAPTCASGGPAM